MIAVIEKEAPVGASDPDAKLITACERHPAVLETWNADLQSINDEAMQAGEGPAGVAHDASRDLIAAAEPQTMAGMLAKARAALAEDDPGTDFASDAHEWAWDVMMDLLRLAGARTLQPSPSTSTPC